MLRHFVLATLLLLSFAAYAEAEPYNRVDFQVEAARDISNDLLTTRMSLEIQDKQPSQVAQRMNTTFNQALQKAASFNAVKTRSGTQNTYPIYGKNNQIEAWRGHGELHIESRDFKAAGELIMQLQNTLQLNDVQFGIAPDTRTSLETALINEAIKAFQNRAEAIRAAMGATSYKTVHFSINTGGLPPRYQVAVMRSTMVASVPVAEPEFASGETHMTVQINATIELQ